MVHDGHAVGDRHGDLEAVLAFQRAVLDIERPRALLVRTLGCFCALHGASRGVAALLGDEPTAVQLEDGEVAGVDAAVLTGGGMPADAGVAAIPGPEGPAALLSAIDRQRTPAAGALDAFLAAAGVAFEALRLRRVAANREQQLDHIAAISQALAKGAELDEIARRMVQGVTEVTDFAVATLTVREDDRCRRVAAAGLADPRIGLMTPLERWMRLLRDEDRRGRMSYLVPPEAPTERSEAPEEPTSAAPDSWTAGHQLVCVLTDDEGAPIGFLSVDAPRSGTIPGPGVVSALERFAGQVQVALIHARLYARARSAAERDSLTGLRNRAVLWRDLAAALDADPRVSLCVVDIDDFKAINDRHGHLVGDRTLVHVADRLLRSVRETDAVYRLGGEEFALLLPGADAEEAVLVAERARAAVARRRPEVLPNVTISVGVAQHPLHGHDGESLFAAADAAMYRAKRAGKDTVVAA